MWPNKTTLSSFSCRELFWTDWGNGRIAKASMDGNDTEILHSEVLYFVDSIALDYSEQRIYWVDGRTRRIEYSSYDGSNRVILLNFLNRPFSLAINQDLVFWTDLNDRGVYVAHKLLWAGIQKLDSFLRGLPFGIIAVSPVNQPYGMFLPASCIVSCGAPPHPPPL